MVYTAPPCRYNAYCCQAYPYSLRQFLMPICCVLSTSLTTAAAQYMGGGGAMCREQCQICLELKAKTTTCPNATSDCYWKHCLKWPIQSSKPIVEPVVGYMSSVSAASLPSMLSLMQCNRLYVPVKLSYLIILSISKNVLELRPCELLYNPNLSDFSQVAEQVRNY